VKLWEPREALEEFLLRDYDTYVEDGEIGGKGRAFGKVQEMRLVPDRKCALPREQTKPLQTQQGE
jgi:hypothetical protein